MSGLDVEFMQIALQEARQAEADGEVPVGAVVVCKGRIVAAARNQVIARRDPTAHAEILALRQAAQIEGNYRLTGCTLYATLEPCAMCAGAAVLARLERLVYGCDDPKAGAVRSLFRIADDQRLNHTMGIERGVLEAKCAASLRLFFQKRRQS
ncbi:MAG: tRNA-specific adenosine deaminase [Acidobacteria bacterium RIFCSPLOWO2_02_FULL_59_13]|nr:MAG: tRNA-specific adenosine deaminase [Acidobacteria bacterium RIFCSPLOWO2_02_FULL_59_13]